MVHLGARRDTVDGHEEELLGLDLAEQMLDVVEDLDEHLIFGKPCLGGRVGVVVGAVVNDTVHVEVEVIELGNAVFGDELGYGRIPLREPAEELGDTCSNSISVFIVM